LFDGYDLAINGVALPLLMKEWGMTAVQAGMLASTALAGMLFCGAYSSSCLMVMI
jgi:AAHS family benzoate transporter-like MFS transporter